MEYILRYGNRRLEACKKLGWKTIPAIIKTENGQELQHISIKKISQIENSRIRIEPKELNSTMNDIQFRGLLQPITISPVNEDVSMEELLSDNLAENIEREDLKPIEEAQVVKTLQKMGYSLQEVSQKLNLPLTRIRTVLRLYANIPKKYVNDIRFIKPSEARNKKGLISAKTAQNILAIRTTKENHELLFEAAKKQNLSEQDIKVIASLMGYGKMDARQAIEKRKEYKVVGLKIPIKIKEYDKYEWEGTQYAFITSFIKGRLKPNPKLTI